MRKLGFVGAGGVELAADVVGDPSHPPALLLHGGGQTRACWGDTVQGLANHGYHVIALDLRGHGESGWSPDGVYTMDLYVGDLRAVCATLGRPAALIGASLGGLTSLLAMGEGEGLDGSALVLVDVAPRLNLAGAATIVNFMRSAPHGFASLEEAADAVSAYIPHRPRPRDVSGLQKNLRRGEDGRLYWHWDPKVLAGEVARQAEAYERLAAAARRIRVPTLLVRGANSEVVTEASVRDFLELVPDAEHRLIRDAHHMVAGDRNTAFGSAVIDFIRSRIPA